MFTINGIDIKEGNEYLIHKRTRITTTIREDYLIEYKKLMKAINQEYCKGFDIMLEMIAEDENLTKEFIDRLRKY